MSGNSTTEEPFPATESTWSVLVSTESTVVEKSPQLRFVFVPLAVLVIVFALSAMVFVFLRKKRVDRLRHHLMPLYNFEPGEDEGDWESELLEEGTDTHRGYKSMDYPHRNSMEMFGSSTR